MINIEWKNTRKNGTVRIGTQQVGDTELEWFITKSAGGQSYQLHMGEVKPVAMVTRATIEDCKEYASKYF